LPGVALGRSSDFAQPELQAGSLRLAENSAGQADLAKTVTLFDLTHPWVGRNGAP